MPAPWSFTSAATVAGRWKLVINGIDVTNFRGTPTRIENYSFTDPFGDSLAPLTFPQITGFDDFDSPDLHTWLSRGSNVDIFWVPTVSGSTVVDPITNKKDKALGTPVGVWEGYIASFDLEEDENGSHLAVQCQGALLQLDRYKAKPAYPARPLPYETMIRNEFDRTKRPNLRTQNLAAVEWPSGWSKVMPGGVVNLYTPVGKPGEKITGYSGRDTGAWDSSLTGFIASLLAVMFTQDDSGVTPGNQWTIRNDPGRQPVLYVRDRYRAPDFSVWYGQVGVKCSRMTSDGTQLVNVIYGEGTSLDGTTWRNAVISADGSSTDYAPLAWVPEVYPPLGNEAYDSTKMVMEGYTRFPSGFDQVPATDSSRKILARDSDPGWIGDMVLTIDPDTMSRFQIRAGMTVNLKGFNGTGATGMNFHIAECSINPEEGSATLKLDTKYRDLLTLEEVVARTRDPLTPTKMLQVNRRTVMIEDIVAPWDYTAGSGYMPTRARTVLAHADRSKPFPWSSITTAFPPKHHPEYYVKVKGKDGSKNNRWTFFPILMAQRGTIRRIEMHAFDSSGNPLAAAFHLSLYYTNVTVTAMPMSNGVHNPFFTGAFESLQPNGLPWPPGNFFAPDDSIIIGWGNSLQPAGYSPGSYQNGNPITGALIDEASWSFDCMNNPNFNKNARVGQKTPLSAIAIHGALYTDYPANVYFMGRMYRQEPGSQ